METRLILMRLGRVGSTRGESSCPLQSFETLEFIWLLWMGSCMKKYPIGQLYTFNSWNLECIWLMWLGLFDAGGSQPIIITVGIFKMNNFSTKRGPTSIELWPKQQCWHMFIINLIYTFMLLIASCSFSKDLPKHSLTFSTKDNVSMTGIERKCGTNL